jgi:hypothetical protein
VIGDWLNGLEDQRPKSERSGDPDNGAITECMGNRRKLEV